MTLLLALVAVICAAAAGYFFAQGRNARRAWALDAEGYAAERRIALAALQAEIAEQLEAVKTTPETPAVPVLDDPPAGSAGPAGREGRSPEAPVDDPPATTEDLDEQEPESPAHGRPAQAGGRGPGTRPITPKQQALVDAVNRLGSASTSEIAKAAGRDGQAIAVGAALKALRDLGLVGHNGQRAKAARWLALDLEVSESIGGPVQVVDLESVPDTPDTQTDITPLDERIIALLVTEHGPVTSTWVADQVVKNRRDTAHRMRDLARAGHLVDLDGSFAAPDLAEAA